MATMMMALAPGVALAQGTGSLRAAVLQVSEPFDVLRIRPESAQAPAGAPQAPGAPLSLNEAIKRGIEFNLMTLTRANAVRGAEAQVTIARSVLLPNISASLADYVQKVNISSLGVQFELPPGFTVPDVVGPFNVLDARARLTQVLFNRAASNQYRAARENVRANEYLFEDARDLIAMSVARAYIQAVAARAQVQSIRAQIDTAAALFKHATMQRTAGLATPIDLNRAEVQTLTQRQRMAAFEAEYAKQKIDLARLVGMPPTDRYDLSDDVPFAAPPVLSVDDAVRQALERRADLMAAEAQLRAAERTLAAADARRLPTVSVDGDYGGNRVDSTPMRSSYSVSAMVRVPLWDGRRTDGESLQARANLDQRRAERDDLRAQIEAEVRKAYLDLDAAASQVGVSEASIKVNRQNLTLTQQRFDSGVGDNLQVVQSQESVAVGEYGFINSVFAHNLAKLGLARAMGRSAEDFGEFLKLR
jgi:outer membrane protein TolC